MTLACGSRFRQWSQLGLAAAALPVSLAAAAVPVVLSKTRSDICHIGFIEGGCNLALLAVFAVRPLGIWSARLAAVLRSAVALLFGTVLVAAVAFYAHALSIRIPGGLDLDGVRRAASSADYIEAQTKPTDRIVVTPYGGWDYVYSRRDNATSFALLLDDPYSAPHWPVAARQILERRPRLLLVPEAHFDLLCSQEPRIRSFYFGYSGNYLLDERGTGPAFPLPARWELLRQPDEVGQAQPLVVELRSHQGQAQLFAMVAGASQDILGAIHGDVFSLFDADRSFVGRLSPDGSRVEGTEFGPSRERQRFSGRRLEP